MSDFNHVSSVLSNPPATRARVEAEEADLRRRGEADYATVNALWGAWEVARDYYLQIAREAGILF